MNIINLEELHYDSSIFFVNHYNNKVIRIYKGYMNTSIEEYHVNESGMIFLNSRILKNIDISSKTVVKIDGLLTKNSDLFYSMQNAYYMHNDRF